jgi:hypothetical protein
MKHCILDRAIRKVLEGFDKGVFLRNTANDALPDWAIKQSPYLTALAILSEYLTLKQLAAMDAKAETPDE